MPCLSLQTRRSDPPFFIESLPLLSSPTPPSVIPDIFNRESRVFSFSLSIKRKTLDSCFRRNDGFWFIFMPMTDGVLLAIFMPGC